MRKPYGNETLNANLELFYNPKTGIWETRQMIVDRIAEKAAMHLSIFAAGAVFTFIVMWLMRT